MPTPEYDLDTVLPVALMHMPVDVTLAPAVLIDFDAADDRARSAAARVAKAYQRAMSAPTAAAPSMWMHVEGQHADFLAATLRGDVETMLASLRSMFHTHLIWGLGRVHEQMAREVKEQRPGGLQIQVADALVSLAEATGAAGVTNIEQQGRDVHAHALHADLDMLLDDLIVRTGLDVDMPCAGGNYGCLIAGRKVSIDSLVHAYTAFRLKQLGAAPTERVAEIGGGYGCLAHVCCRNGFSNYTVFDLPWVNILQGYLLIMSLGADRVSVLGEPDRAVNIRPFWEFFALAERSVDIVINTDSLPEIGVPTARRYIADIARVIRRCFLSINQEAMMAYPGVGRQARVNALVAGERCLQLAHRSRYWMRQGYVEEVFVPSPARR